MAEEIQEAVQIIRVAYDGIEIAMKVGSGGISAMQKAIDFLKGMLDYEKSLGKTSMRKLLLKGGDLQVLQFKTEDMKKVEKMAKKYGILYSVLPDCNKKDGMSEIIFHTEAVPRVNMMIQKLKFGKPYVHQIRGTDNLIGPPFEILSEKAVRHYEKMKEKGENVYIDSLTYEQFMMLGDTELNRRFSMQDEAEQKAKIDREQANELEYVDESQKSDDSGGNNTGDKPVRNPEREKPEWEDTITNRMLHWSYTPEQKEEVKKALAAGVPKATILTYFYPEVTVEKMSSYRMKQ